MGQYKNLDAAQAVKGSALADQLLIVQMLHIVSPTLVFKYGQVKDAFGRVFKERPGVRGEFPVIEQLKLGETLAEAILVLCNHARQLARSNKSSGKLAPGW